MWQEEIVYPPPWFIMSSEALEDAEAEMELLRLLDAEAEAEVDCTRDTELEVEAT